MAASEKAERQNGVEITVKDKEKEEKAKKLVEDLYQFNRCYFETHTIDDAFKKETDLQSKMEETLQKLSLQEDTLPRPLYQYLRGKSLNVLTTHSKEAELLLSQAVKQNPGLVDAWNSLGESYWKIGNVGQAHHCFTGALRHELNKESLRNLSMVLRQMGKDESEKKSNISESLEKAKEAVSLDVKDGTSWMILGNAYLAVYFSVEANPKSLQQATSAYSQAEKDSITLKNPDLHFNMATLQIYEESYTEGLTHLELASKYDPGWPTPHQKLTSLKRFLQNFTRLVATKGKLKPKRLSTLQESVTVATQGTDYSDGKERVTVKELRQGGVRKEGCVLIGCIVACFTTDERVPLACVLIDSNGDSIGCTIYNLIHSFQFNIGDLLTITDPVLSQIHIGEIEVEYDNIRITRPDLLYCNNKLIPRDKMSTSIAQVTAFS